MKILYVAKHDSGDNDDEGAIRYALEKLGHEVVCVDEKQEFNFKRVVADFCLFHKWSNMRQICDLRIPCAFWYFDLVTSNERLLNAHLADRPRYLCEVLSYCLCGFCTDGDWVAKDKTGKLIHLMQGCDERKAGMGRQRDDLTMPPIVFTGTCKIPGRRRKHVHELQNRYQDKFLVIGGGGAGSYTGRVHGEKLSRIFANTKVVVAPISPASDKYWSNRVYLTTSLGGFLVHPRCEMLVDHYIEGEEIVYYDGVLDSFEKIDYYLEHDKERERIRLNGHRRALRSNTYYHRCQRLIEHIKERL
jgi:hypothetical protein